MQPEGGHVRHNSIVEMDNLILSIQKADSNINEKDLAVKMGYKSGYFSQCRSRNFAPAKLLLKLKTQKDVLQKANFGNKPADDTSYKELNDLPEVDRSQPIIQVVLNLSYIGKKNADSIDKMADSNLLNAKSISTLVSLLASNSDLSALLTPSQEDQHKDEGLPVEAFLGKSGIGFLKQQSGKKKAVGK